MMTELMWALHNLVAHPVSEICYWLRFVHPSINTFGTWLHDRTIPKHVPGTGRG